MAKSRRTQVSDRVMYRVAELERGGLDGKEVVDALLGELPDRLLADVELADRSHCVRSLSCKTGHDKTTHKHTHKHTRHNAHKTHERDIQSLSASACCFSV